MYVQHTFTFDLYALTCDYDSRLWFYRKSITRFVLRLDSKALHIEKVIDIYNIIDLAFIYIFSTSWFNRTVQKIFVSVFLSLSLSLSLSIFIYLRSSDAQMIYWQLMTAPSSC